MKITRNTLLWLYLVFAFKVLSIGISFIARATGWNWVPQTSNTVLVTASAFVLSSLIFLTVVPKLGLASTATYGALTFYGATTSVITGAHIPWSIFAALTGLALVSLSIHGWRQLSVIHPPIEG